MFYELLFELSMADGYLEGRRRTADSAINIFGIDPNLFEINKENLVRFRCL